MMSVRVMGMTVRKPTASVRLWDLDLNQVSVGKDQPLRVASPSSPGASLVSGPS